MREIRQGTLYGYELVLKVPESEYESFLSLNYNLEDYLKEKEKYAVQVYKDEQMLKNMDNVAKEKYATTGLQKLIVKLFTKS